MKTKNYVKRWKDTKMFLSMIKEMDPRIIVLTYANAFVRAVTPYVSYVFFSRSLDALNARAWKSAIGILLLMIGSVMLLRGITGILKNRIETRRQLLYTKFKCNLHMHYMELDYDTVEQYETRELMKTANNLVDMYGGLEELIGQTGRIMEAVCGIVVAIVLFLGFLARIAVSPLISRTEVVLTIGAVILVLCSYSYGMVRNTKRYSEESKELLGKHGYHENALSYYLNHIYENADSKRDIKLYHMETLVQRKFDRFLAESGKNFERMRDSSFLHQTKASFYHMIYHIISFLLLFRHVALRTITPGLFTQYYSSMLNLSQMVSQFIMEIGNIEMTCAHLMPYAEFMNRKPTAKENAGSPLAIEKVKEITFQDVSFRYPGSKDDVLRHFSHTFVRGTNTAIVGKNGAGKSTLIKLLCGLYRPTSGKILIDGIDLSSLDESQRNQMFGSIVSRQNAEKIMPKL